MAKYGNTELHILIESFDMPQMERRWEELRPLVSVSNTAGWSPLRTCVVVCKEDAIGRKIMTMLLDSGADARKGCVKGNLLPVHEAARMGKFAFAEMILERYPDTVVSQTCMGLTVVHYVIMSAKGAQFLLRLIATFLHQHPGLLEAPTSEQLRPVHYAAEHARGDLSILQILRDNRVNFNSLTNEGNNSAHYAGAVKDRTAFDFTVAQGADAWLPNHNHWTPWGKLLVDEIKGLARQYSRNLAPERVAFIELYRGVTREAAREIEARIARGNRALWSLEDIKTFFLYDAARRIEEF